MSNAMYSTPVYQDYLSIRAQASAYVIVLEQDDDAVLEQIYAQLESKAPYHILIQSHPNQQGLEDIQQALMLYLHQAKAGVHTVVVGSEVFVWQIQHALEQQSCLPDEYSLICIPYTAKSVYCVHCAHQYITHEAEYCHCEACGVYLLIRTHFSQRLGAYMGVCANAQQPMGATA